MARYSIAVDIGGTFVDSILFDLEDGTTRLSKAPTTPDEPSRGVMAALRGLNADLAEAETFIHGTTLGLNAVIERRGVPTGVITNEGFRDILEIGRGDVPAASMYDYAYRRPEPLVRRRHRIGVPGRLDARGAEVTPLDEAAVVAAARTLVDDGVESIAVAFLHSYRNPVHEEAAAAAIRRALPDIAVSVSSGITREYREYERTATVVTDAYLSPIFSRYIDQLAAALADGGFGGRFLIMRSAGGAMSSALARRTPIHTVLSGPAGGVIGATHLARLLGKDQVLTLDYGGTSLDTAVIEQGEPMVIHEARLGTYPAQIPVFDVRCIGAGGGSIAWVSEGLLQVGPQSAGASPGPIAYGRGGTEPTTTDAALLLGYLDPGAFLGGALQLDVDAARAGMASRVAGPLGIDVEPAAAAVFDVLIARTAGAVREITVERGKDPRDFSMLAFGGAGPLIAPLIAREIDNAELIVPVSPAVFSAWGMLMSDLAVDFAQTSIQPLAEGSEPGIEREFATLVQDASAALLDQGADASAQHIHCFLECRYVGQEHVLAVPVARGGVSAIVARAAFETMHRERYGHATGGPVQLVTLRVRGTSAFGKPDLPCLPAATGPASGAELARRPAFCFAQRALTEFVVYDRARLAPGHRFDGPAIVDEGTATTVVHSDQSVTVDDYGNLIVRRRL